MEIAAIIAGIDEEIERLQQVRALLNGGGGFPGPFAKEARKKRVLSADARARIAAAQKRRWAAKRKAAKKAA
jgi:hypothetical protein